MKKLTRGQTIVPVVLFIVFSVVFVALSITSYSEVVTETKTLNHKKEEQRKAEKELKLTKEKIDSVINVLGFQANAQNYNYDIILDTIATKIVVMGNSSDLGLGVGIRSKASKNRYSIPTNKKIFESLELGVIPESLRKGFKEPLSENAMISYHSSDQNWWIIGGARQSKVYLLEKKSGRVNVYPVFDKNQLENARYVSEIVGLQEIWNACIRRIIYQSENETERGLTQQLQERQKSLANLTKKFKREQDRSARKVQEKINAIKNIRKGNKEIKEQTADGQIKVKQKSLVIREKRLQAKEIVTKLEKKKLHQERVHKNMKENMDERIRELEEEAKGQLGLEDRLSESITKIDAFFQAEKAPKAATGETKTADEQIQAKVKTQETPDGEIVYVDEKSQTAYIDLGRSQGILKGLRFEIFRYGKGGIAHKKGEIVVREMEANMSMAGITKLEDPLDPVIAGDKIINRVYDRNKTKYFVIAGRLKKYSMQELGYLVEKLGGKIEKKISAKTDFVVLGEGFKKHPIYKKATERGIEMILESEFLNYLED